MIKSSTKLPCSHKTSTFKLFFLYVVRSHCSRGGASPEQVGWKRDRIDGQKVSLTIFILFCLGININLRKGVDRSTTVHPVASPLHCSLSFRDFMPMESLCRSVTGLFKPMICTDSYSPGRAGKKCSTTSNCQLEVYLEI